MQNCSISITLISGIDDKVLMPMDEVEVSLKQLGCKKNHFVVKSKGIWFHSIGETVRYQA